MLGKVFCMVRAWCGERRGLSWGDRDDKIWKLPALKQASGFRTPVLVGALTFHTSAEGFAWMAAWNRGALMEILISDMAWFWQAPCPYSPRIRRMLNRSFSSPYTSPESPSLFPINSSGGESDSLKHSGFWRKMVILYSFASTIISRLDIYISNHNDVQGLQDTRGFESTMCTYFVGLLGARGYGLASDCEFIIAGLHTCYLSNLGNLRPRVRCVSSSSWGAKFGKPPHDQSRANTTSHNLPGFRSTGLIPWSPSMIMNRETRHLANGGVDCPSTKRTVGPQQHSAA